MVPTRTFWLRMQYQCNRSSCGYQVPMLLEDGCEGPRPPQPPRGPTIQALWRTTGGRTIVPVPFVAGRCPNCGTGDLMHVNWGQDEALQPPVEVVGEPECPYFRYPSNPRVHGACGHPVFP